MNSPAIDSMPATAAERPDTVAPNTTSGCPLCRASATAHAPCTTVFTVTR